MGEEQDIDGAQSDIEYFVTPTDQPTKPRKIDVKKIDSHSVEISWEPPESPNGIIEYYGIYLQLYPIDKERIMQRPFCEPNFEVKQVNELIETQPDEDKNIIVPNEDVPNARCSCTKCSNENMEPSTGTGNSKEQSAKKNAQNEFENALLDAIWVLPDDIAGTNCNEGKRKKRDIPSDGSNRLGLSVDKETNLSASSNMENEHLHIFKKVNSSISSLSVPNLKHFGSYVLKIRACQQGNHIPLVDTLECSPYAVEVFQVLHDPSADDLDGIRIAGERNKHTNDGELDSGIDRDIEDDFQKKKGEPVFIAWDPPPDPNLLIVNYDILLEFDDQQDSSHMECVSAKEFEEHNRM